MTAHGHFHWNELMSWDVEQAKNFYADTIGWTFDGTQMPDGMYWIAMNGDQMAGGLFQLNKDQSEGTPEGWIAYLSVDDIDARVAKAKAAGATIVREPFDVPMVGRIALIQEPGGAMIGWMTPAEQPQAA